MKKRIISLFLAVFMIVGIIPLSAITTFAEETVGYLAYNESTRKMETCVCTKYIPLTANTNTLEDGKWYVADGVLTINHRLVVNGNAHLILKDECELTVVGGINVVGFVNPTFYTDDNGHTQIQSFYEELNSITIFGQAEGTGSLIADASNLSGASGIGGGSSADGGTINIHGGRIEAYGGENAAGIGGGYNGCGTALRIFGGYVNATGGYHGAGIGAGDHDFRGIDVYICGGNVVATSGTDGEAIGHGCTDWVPEAWNFDGSINVGENDKLYNGLNGDEIDPFFSTGESGLLAIKMISDCDEEGRSKVSFFAVNENYVPQSINYLAYNTENLQTETRTIPASKAFLFPSDNVLECQWYIVDCNLTIDDKITVKGDVNLILKDNCDLTVNGGINVIEGNSLTIYAQSDGEHKGRLSATGINYSSGIGSEVNVNAGKITIHGGDITAKGDTYCAGIGGRENTIYGGDITATGGNAGAGIGGGISKDGGKITVFGGKITANGGFRSAGIGGGSGADGGTIAIHGGEITANGGGGAAGVGIGSAGNSGTIIIDGGIVTANGGQDGVGIGKGYDGTFKTDGDIEVKAAENDEYIFLPSGEIINDYRYVKIIGNPNRISVAVENGKFFVTASGERAGTGIINILLYDNTDMLIKEMTFDLAKGDTPTGTLDGNCGYIKAQWWTDSETKTPLCKPVEWKFWTSENTLPTTSGTYILENDITLLNAWNVQSGETITLDLNGHTLKRNLTEATANGYVIATSGNLTILDSSKDKTGTITGGLNSGNGGGIYVGGGTLTMNDIAVSGNSAVNGGGIYLEQNTVKKLVLTDCKIENNTTSRLGSGFCLNSGTTTLINCEISNNRSEYFGGGFFIDFNAYAKLTGCTVSGNSAKNGGGAFEMEKDDSELVLEDSTVTGNSVDAENGGIKKGGGIHFYKGSVTLNGDVTIQNNTCAGEVNNICMRGNTVTFDANKMSARSNVGVNDAILTIISGITVENVNGLSMDNGDHIIITNSKLTSHTPNFLTGYIDNGNGTHSHKCLYCERRINTEAHSFENHKCVICGVVEVKYLYYNEESKMFQTDYCCGYKMIDEEGHQPTEWKATDGSDEIWYVVSGAPRIEGDVTASGKVHLILTDKSTLTINGTISGENAHLYIYTQFEDVSSGTIIVNGKSGSDGVYGADLNGESGGDGITITALTVNGGAVTVTGGNGGNGCKGDETYETGICQLGNGGDGGDGIKVTTLVVNNGMVLATGGDGGNATFYINHGVEEVSNPGNGGDGIKVTDLAVNGGIVSTTGGISVGISIFSDCGIVGAGVALDKDGEIAGIVNVKSNEADEFIPLPSGKSISDYQFAKITKTYETPLKIRSASLHISEDINVIYAAEVPEGCTDPYMVFTLNDRTYTVDTYTVNSNGQYCFELAAVTPQCMGDNISATLYATVDGCTASVTKAEYSVRTYCTNLLAKTDDELLITLLSDLLTYGAAAQTYTNYKTDALVTDGLSLFPSTFPELSGLKEEFDGTADPDTIWKSASLTLRNNVDMNLCFHTDSLEDLSVVLEINDRTETVTDFAPVDGEEGLYQITFHGILATEFDLPVSASFYRDGAQVGNTLNYSVNTYICSKQNESNAALAAMVRALYNYGATANTYYFERYLKQ